MIQLCFCNNCWLCDSCSYSSHWLNLLLCQLLLQKRWQLLLHWKFHKQETGNLYNLTQQVAVLPAHVYHGYYSNLNLAALLGVGVAALAILRFFWCQHCKCKNWQCLHCLLKIQICIYLYSSPFLIINALKYIHPNELNLVDIGGEGNLNSNIFNTGFIFKV